MTQETFNLMLSGLMGIIGGLITIPLNAHFSMKLKRDELQLQNRLNIIAKSRELMLDHQLQMERIGKENEIREIKTKLEILQVKVEQLSNQVGNDEI